MLKKKKKQLKWVSIYPDTLKIVFPKMLFFFIFIREWGMGKKV